MPSPCRRARAASGSRTSLLLPDGVPLVRAAVKGLVYANVLTVDRCLGAIAAAAAGEISVAEALERLDL